MEILSLIVGFCALLFAIGVYVIHDRKLKQQQKILNEYQLKVLTQNIAEQQKAEIRVSIKDKKQDSSGNWTGTLIIANYGKAPAYNVRFNQIGRSFSYNLESKYYSQLLPQENQETYLYWRWDNCDPKETQVTWDDDSDKNRTHKCVLDL